MVNNTNRRSRVSLVQERLVRPNMQHVLKWCVNYIIGLWPASVVAHLCVLSTDHALDLAQVFQDAGHLVTPTSSYASSAFSFCCPLPAWFPSVMMIMVPSLLHQHVQVHF
jgi:hypothetical protein